MLSSRPVLREEGDRTPNDEDEADNHEKGDPARAICRVRHAFGSLTLSILPPGEAVPDDERSTQRQDELRQQVLEVE